MSDPVLPEAIAARLAALPRFEPRETLWSEVRARRRRGRALRAGLAAAAVLAIAVLAIAHRPAAPPAVDAGADLAQMRTLEDALAEARVARPANPAVHALERELARIDRALQLAYDHAAPEHERAALWRTRADQLDALALAYRHADTIVRL